MLLKTINNVFIDFFRKNITKIVNVQFVIDILNYGRG